MKHETEINIFGDKTITLNWDDMVQDLQDGTPDDATKEVASEIYWAVALPHIGEPEEAKRKFWDAFNDVEASRKRSTALYGLRATNVQDAACILDDALSCGDRTGKRRMQSLIVLGARIEELVVKGDYKTLKDMGSIIEDGSIEGKRGNKNEIPAMLLRAFAMCHLDEFKLPTKKQIRERSGLHLTKAQSDLDNALKAIGLGGLPPS